MSAVPKKKLSVEEYLAIEREAEFKSEFYKGEMHAMDRANRVHNFLTSNLQIGVGSGLKGNGCRTVGQAQRIRVDATGLYTYPDLIIYCGQPLFDPRDPDTLLNPAVVFEVLSKSTENYDRGKKFRNYRTIPSLREYILVSQEEPLIERYVRQPDDSWVLTNFNDPAGLFSLGTLPVRVPMADVYRDVEFPAE